MSNKTPSRVLARRLQQSTGAPYSTCLRLASRFCGADATALSRVDAADWEWVPLAAETAQSEAVDLIVTGRRLAPRLRAEWLDEGDPARFFGYLLADTDRTPTRPEIAVLLAGARPQWRFEDPYAAWRAERVDADRSPENWAACRRFEEAQEHLAGLDADSPGLAAARRVRDDALAERAASAPVIDLSDPLSQVEEDFERHGDPDRFDAALEKLLMSNHGIVDAWVARGTLACVGAFGGNMGPLHFSAHPDAGFRASLLELGAGFFETAVVVGQKGIPAHFTGAIPWNALENRPFLRALHGLALCYWSAGRHEDALRLLTSLLWLNPADNQGARHTLAAVSVGAPYPAP